MTVPFLDLSTQHAPLMPDIIERFTAIGLESSFVLGQAVADFENEFADYLGAKHVIGVASGMDALYLTLAGMDIGPGDEVLVPANTFVASAHAVLRCGACPVLVDCEPDSFLMNLSGLDEKLTPRTKAIMPVHLYGMAADMQRIGEFAAAHQLRVVEDTAQAHGAELRNRNAGTWGDAGCFSFYPGKNLGAFGDGGAVCTDDDQLADDLRKRRNYGAHEKYRYVMRGENSRLDSVQAAVLSTKLKHLDAWNESRWEAAAVYHEGLAHLEAHGLLQRPLLKAPGQHVFHLYTILVEGREAIRQRLAERHIQTGIHYPCPFYLEPPYHFLGYQPGDFPVTEDICRRTLSLPLFPGIRAEQIQYVCEEITRFFEESE
jgi:dTDP-4-amino-4,6-dideoxygalactose transaminase